jgi:D-alanyl-D-alanine carboxypeptidase
VGKRGSGKAKNFVEGARRLRRRAEWLAAILVLLSVPTLWFLLQQMDSVSVPTVVRPATQAISLPQVPEATRNETAGRCDDPKVLVDRSHALPADYEPDDLVSLRGLGVPILGQDVMLRREAAVNLESLVSSAAASGEELAVASGYRSYEDQRASYARLVSVFGKGADRTSAPPGHSQHQLGTAVDFTNAAVGYEVMQKFGRTTAAGWLQEHAHEHGFVLSYPPGRHARTGYHWEPWHYRYVGEENARRAIENPLGLQGFLLQEGVLPNC